MSDLFYLVLVGCNVPAASKLFHIKVQLNGCGS